MVMLDQNKIIDSQSLREAYEFVRQLRDIILNSPSWSDEAKQAAEKYLNLAMGALACCIQVSDAQDDLK